MSYKIEFDAEKHIYTVDGVRVPSVTEILRFLSVDTAASAAPWMRAQAAEIGTAVHEATVLYDYVGFDEELYDVIVLPYIKGYHDFKRDYRIKDYILTEEKITNGAYAGALDRLVMLDRKPTILDFKSGTTVDPRKEAGQVYGYAKILADNRFLGYTHYSDFAGMIVRLKRDGSYQAIYRDLQRGRIFFEHCRELNDLITEDKKHGNRIAGA